MFWHFAKDWTEDDGSGDGDGGAVTEPLGFEEAAGKCVLSSTTGFLRFTQCYVEVFDRESPACPWFSKSREDSSLIPAESNHSNQNIHFLFLPPYSQKFGGRGGGGWGGEGSGVGGEGHHILYGT